MKFLIRDNFFKSVPKEKLETVISNLKYFYQEIERNYQNIKNIPKGFWIKKLAGSENRFEFRVNNGDRIFFSLNKRGSEEERITFILYSSHDRGVKKSKNAEILLVKDFEIFKDDFESSREEEIDKSIFTDYNNVITYEIKDDSFFILNKDSRYFYYYLNDEQYETIISQPPVFIVGSAGSGKSTITLRKILNIEEHNEVYGFEKIGYFTGNSYLKDNLLEQYDIFRDKSKEKIAEFYTLKEFYKKELGIDTRKIVNFKKFMEFLSFSFPNIKKLKIEKNNIYFEIMGIIKGLMIKDGTDNWEKDTDVSLISFEEYKNLSKKYSVLDEKLKAEIYKIALKYEEWKKSENLYDMNDLAAIGVKTRKKFDFILIDEVQDLTEVEIYFLTTLVKNSENIIFAGDIHQMVNFNSFSFDRLKNLYYKNKTEYSMSILTKNYRSSKEIVKLANHFTDLRKKYIGNLGMDDYKEGAILDDGKIELSSVDYKLMEKYQKDVNSAIIVPDDEERAKISENSDVKHRIFTVEEIKGLEYKNIICCNLISKNLWAWKKILSGNVKQDQRYRKYFNLFYVGITRARKNLTIMEDNLENNILLKNIKSFINFTEKDKLQPEEESTENSSFSSQEEWLEEGKKLYKLEKFDEAQYAFEQGGYPTWIAERETEIDIENGDYKTALEKIEKGNFKKPNIYFQKLIIDNVMENENYIKALRFLESFDIPYKYFEIKKKIAEGIENGVYTVKDINKIIPMLLNKKEFFLVGESYFSIKKYELAMNFYKKASNIEGVIKARREILKEKFKNMEERDEKIETAEQLIGKKEPWTVDRTGLTPLMKAMNDGYSTDIGKILTALGVDINTKINLGEETGKYIHFSQFIDKKYQRKWLEFLVKYGADINSETSMKRTPIFFAASFENNSSIDFLLENGCDVNRVDMDGETVDFYEVRKRRIKYFKFFIQKMVQPDKKNKHGETILDILNKMKEIFVSNEKETRKIALMEKIYKKEVEKKRKQN